MGARMAGNLARARFPLTVWNRTPGRTGALGGRVQVAESLPALASASEIVVLCVSDTPDVEQILWGRDEPAEGLAEHLEPGSLVVDCSTISPSATRRFAERLAARGVAMVDAPVSGGSEGAEQATLTIMVGGDERDVDRARPVLNAMGRTVTRIGPSGSGQAAKAVNQVMLCGAYLGVAEGLVLAIKSGLDLEPLLEALSAGAARSWVLENRSRRMVADDYPLGFKISLHLKDLAIALDLARANGASLPVAALAAQIENGLVAQGYGDDDVSALARAIRAWAGL